MVYEVYKPRIKKGNLISITKNHIVLKPYIVENLKSNLVELSYDREVNIIRIKPTEEEGFSINKNKIGVRGFLKYFNIEGKGKYPFRYDDEENAIYIDLADKI